MRCSDYFAYFHWEKGGEFNLLCHDPQAKRKVLSTHDVNRSGSKRSGCPRPVASSSYPLQLVLCIRDCLF